MCAADDDDDQIVEMFGVSTFSPLLFLLLMSALHKDLVEMLTTSIGNSVLYRI